MPFSSAHNTPNSYLHIYTQLQMMQVATDGCYIPSPYGKKSTTTTSSCPPYVLLLDRRTGGLVRVGCRRETLGGASG